ncbi:MAG: response regulator [Nitrospirae bacterium]|nr:response regulator [Nitrospirota bacterium]
MKKILVIDDEEIIRKSFQKILTPEGFEVKLASSGHEGISSLQKESFGVVLLDLKMPDMDGMDVLKEIKENWPETKVIIVTGYSTPEAKEEALRLGASDHIDKPFIPDILTERVRKAFNND